MMISSRIIISLTTAVLAFAFHSSAAVSASAIGGGEMKKLKKSKYALARQHNPQSHSQMTFQVVSQTSDLTVLYGNGINNVIGTGTQF